MDEPLWYITMIYQNSTSFSLFSITKCDIPAGISGTWYNHPYNFLLSLYQWIRFCRFRWTRFDTLWRINSRILRKILRFADSLYMVQLTQTSIKKWKWSIVGFEKPESIIFQNQITQYGFFLWFDPCPRPVKPSRDAQMKQALLRIWYENR